MYAVAFLGRQQKGRFTALLATFRDLGCGGTRIGRAAGGG